MTARLALTVGQSARARQEISSGALQADAVDLGDDPSRVAEQGEALELALLALLEKLSATERRPTSFERRSTIPTGGSPTCWGSARQTPGRSLPARAVASAANDADASARLSTDACSTASSPPRMPVISRRSNGCSLRTSAARITHS